MEKSNLFLFSIAVAIGTAGSLKAQTAASDLFGSEPHEIGIPEAVIFKAVNPEPGPGNGLKSRNLPRPGRNILKREHFGNKESATAEYQGMLKALQEMNVKIIDSPENGVQFHTEPIDGVGLNIHYGYTIVYEGPEISPESYAIPRQQFFKNWEIDAAVSALKRSGAHIRSVSLVNISYVRYKSRPMLRNDYDIVKSKSQVENSRSRMEQGLLRKGLEVLFNRTIEVEQYWGDNNIEYHVVVVYIG
ncbi:MAG: hypothetical protein FD189_411 [Elusimicrobia bacterium]|nr:MAG: hypothetical protein FD154_491 [Elusimicrobiota bacterium]KAF0157890.1 MAG: hypothetical protein FD189_411 [Elusimicrobiota bacterium]